MSAIGRLRRAAAACTRTTFDGMVPPTLRFTSVKMQDDRSDRRRVLRLALPASLAAHAIIAALMIFGLPHALEKPQDEQAVSVDLVPPPEPKQEPPQKKEPEKPPEKKPETQRPASPAAPKPQAAPSIKPVFQFGEKDSGPRMSVEGNSSEEGSNPPAPTKDPDQQTPASQPPMLEAETGSEPSLPEVAMIPEPRPTDAKPGPNASKLKQAKTLFSQSATGGISTTAMGSLPREVRGGTLCTTELREQLLRASPPYFPDLLPSNLLGGGNVIDVPLAAFRAGGKWLDLSYRCEVDPDAMKVVSFGFRVGQTIPRSEWTSRGFPAQ